MVQIRNAFGDLPLHVACSVGVPIETLRLVLERTLAATARLVEHKNRLKSGPDALIWSVNRNGYTPIHLEWMRRIEGGRGVDGKKAKYPLSSRRDSRKRGMYCSLLSETVEDVREFMDSPSHANRSREETARLVVGSFFDRCLVILQGAHSKDAASRSNSACGSKPTEEIGSSSRECVERFIPLHAASALSSAGSRTSHLPLPLLELLLLVYPNDIHKRDSLGRFPLHHAAIASPPLLGGETSGLKNEFSYSQPLGWTESREHAIARCEKKDAKSADGQRHRPKTSIQLLLQHSSRAASVSDNDLSLPLHHGTNQASHKSGSTRRETHDAI